MRRRYLVPGRGIRAGTPPPVDRISSSSANNSARSMGGRLVLSESSGGHSSCRSCRSSGGKDAVMAFAQRRCRGRHPFVDIPDWDPCPVCTEGFQRHNVRKPKYCEMNIHLGPAVQFGQEGEGPVAHALDGIAPTSGSSRILLGKHCRVPRSRPSLLPSPTGGERWTCVARWPSRSPSVSGPVNDSKSPGRSNALDRMGGASASGFGSVPRRG